MKMKKIEIETEKNQDSSHRYRHMWRVAVIPVPCIRAWADPIGVA
jgi:hypothetical protein